MTKVKAFISAFLSPAFLLGSSISLVIAFVALIYYVNKHNPKAMEENPFFQEVEKLHNFTVDFRLNRRGPRKGSEDVVILTADEAAIKRFGRWPWPRIRIAEAIDAAISGGAATISFDIVFAEPQDNVINSLEEVKRVAAEKIPQSRSSLVEMFDEQITTYNHDRTLTKVVKHYSEKLIMGAYYDYFDRLPYEYQDICHTFISKKNGQYDYWDKEDFIIGVQDPTEFVFPEKWEEMVMDHLHRLDLGRAYELLQISESNLAKYFNRHKIPTNAVYSVELVNQMIKGNKEKYKEILSSIANPQHRTLLNWSMMTTLLSHQEAVDISEFQERDNRAYCDTFLLIDHPDPSLKDDVLLKKVEENWEEIRADSEKLAKMSFEDGRNFIMAHSYHNYVQHIGNWVLNIPALQEVTVHTGSFNAHQDKDGSVRRSNLFVRLGNQYVPTLALKAFLVANNYNLSVIMEENEHDTDADIPSKVVKAVELSDDEGNVVHRIPTNLKGQLPINYAGPDRMFAYLSAGELLNNLDTMKIHQRVKNDKGNWDIEEIKVNRKEFLKGKHLIFGATAIGVYDLRVTPFAENYPGVETHANVLDNLLRGDYLRTTAAEEKWMPFLLFGFGILFSFFIAKMGALFGLFLALLSGFGIYYVDSTYVFAQGKVINIIFPYFTVISLYTFLTFFKYFTEERKKKQLKGTFQKYVSPAIVNEILKDPTKLELGGRKQEMSVFFSDVRGFTTISEQLDPQALSDLLNDYLTPMTAIIFENAGTLDKYMGDAIMAFFGAPIPSKNHAAQACRSSLIQIEKLKELQKKYAAQGLPMIDIGIGVNTGDMSVGNMGSQTVRNYTVMGDAVNLGARLEGINKQYGTRIIISEFTRTHVEGENFIIREIDWVKVKGKNEPVKIYELVMEGSPDTELAQRLQFFEKGFASYHSRSWEQAIKEFNSALNIHPDDACSQLYIQRCKAFVENPPDDDWDGVFTMTTK